MDGGGIKTAKRFHASEATLIICQSSVLGLSREATTKAFRHLELRHQSMSVSIIYMYTLMNFLWSMKLIGVKIISDYTVVRHYNLFIYG